MLENNHSNFNEVIDKYMLNQLSNEEESQFEEHLLFCDQCQNDLENRKDTINVIWQIATEQKKKGKAYLIKKKDYRNQLTYIILKVAASIIIVLSITFLVSKLYDKELNNKKTVETTILNDTSKILNTNVHIKDKVSTNNDKISVNESFKELPEFENFIKNNALRTEKTILISPKSSAKVKRNEIIIISWTAQNIDSLYFVVYNNKGKLIFEHKVPQRYEYRQELAPALYYWQLETKDEALHVDKFIIKN